MIRIAVMVANETEDIELVVPVDIWRRAGFLVKLISVEKKKNVILSHGVKVSCDEILAKENLVQYHAIYLPGGAGHNQFNEEIAPRLVAFAKKNYKNPKIAFMAICAATECFYSWGILESNIKVTCYPGVQEGKFESNYVKQDVVISKNFITASGPGTASQFAFKVIEHFENANKAKTVAKQMLFNK